MLTELLVQDFIIIEKLRVPFQPGLSVLTGETGAGKSILLDALGFVLGRRSDSNFVRQSASQALVSAHFDLPDNHTLHQIFQEYMIPWDGSLLIRRVLNKNGRSRAFVNDHPVSVHFLQTIGSKLVEIHGQFDRLLQARLHLNLLDSYAGAQDLQQRTQTAYHAWRDQEKQYIKQKTHLEHLRQNEELFRLHLQELETLDPAENEEEHLLEKRQALSHFSRLYSVLQQAHQALTQHQALPALETAQRALNKIEDDTNNTTVKAAQQALSAAVSETTETLARLEELIIQAEDQPQQLQALDDRLHALRATAKKHHILVDQLHMFWKNLENEIQQLDEAEQNLAQYAQAVTHTQAAYAEVAEQLHQLRVKHATLLDACMMTALPELMLPQARFRTHITQLPETQWTQNGLSAVEFEVAMNQGQDFHPLAKAASGGELARLMLCLKSILATHQELTTLVLDEIDIGVGGAIATAIGEKLKNLAHNMQVITITHSPQVAAAGTYHYHVSKVQSPHSATTHIALLSYEQRHEEIARMLSGSHITPEARAAAENLLLHHTIKL